MFGMKLPMPHFCFKTDHSCEKAAGIFIKANEREATLKKEYIFQKIFIWKIHGSSMSCNEKFTTQESLPWILRCILLVWKIRLLWDRAAVPVLYESRHTILSIGCWLHQTYTMGLNSFLTWRTQISLENLQKPGLSCPVHIFWMVYAWDSCSYFLFLI